MSDTWTSQHPQEDGFYWFKQDQQPPEIVACTADGTVWMDEHNRYYITPLSRFGPRIPSPDELARYRDLVAAHTKANP